MCCFKSTILALLLLLVTSSAGQGVSQGQSGAEKPEVALDGSTVLVDGRPFFPRMIQHNGESFEFLKSLGFNTVQLTGPASEKQLREAAAAKVRIVCPPPAFLGVRSVSRNYQPVLAWSVGNNVTANQVQLARERITDIKDADSFERPVFIHAKSHWATYAQLTGILGVGEPVIGTNGRLREYGRWISTVSRNQIQPVWADVQTELPKSLVRQVDAFTGSSMVAPLQHQQMCFQMYEVITAGCRGIRFLSRNRLDASDPETRLRVTSLRWLLDHAQQLEPWVAGGLVRKKGSLSTPNRQVFSITLPGSQVLLIQRSTGFEQWSCGDIRLETIDFASVSSSSSDRVYRVNEMGATALPSPDSVRGTRIKVRNAGASTAILITADPIVVSRLNAQISGVPTELQQRLELVRQALAYIQFIEQRLAATGVGFPFVGGLREQASKDFANAEQILARGDFDVARQYLVKADVNIASISRQLIEQQLNSGIGYFSTPLLMHAGLVPAHLSSATRFSATQWNPNSLTGGDFENLDQMTRAGWKNRRDNENGLTTRVELEQTAAVQGTYGLKLTVEGVSPNIGLQASPLWIESAPVAVKQGQLIRIHGFVNVSEMGFGGRAFEITDSISGNELAVPFESTNGWQEFTIYRAAARDTKMTIVFSVNGIGTAMVDEVTVRSMDPATLKEQAKTQASEIK